MKPDYLIGVRSHFSIGESTLTIKDIVQFGKDKKLDTIFLADTMSVSGIPEFSKLCVEAGIRPIVGCRLRIFPDPSYRPGKYRGEGDGTYYPKVWVKNSDGLKDLFGLLSAAYSEENFYYKARVGYKDLIGALRKGNLILSTGDIGGLFSDEQALFYKELEGEFKVSHFPDSIFLEISPIETPYFDKVNKRIIEAFHPSVCSHVWSYPVLYKAGGADSLDVLRAIIDHHVMSAPYRSVNHIRTFDMDMPSSEKLEALSGKMLRRLESRYELKSALCPNIDNLESLVSWRWTKMAPSLPVISPDEMKTLIEDCKLGWTERLNKEVLGYRPNPVDLPAYKARLAYELGVIKKMGFERYFLLVKDIVGWSKANGIKVGPGRGSVGGSLVAYLIGITDVDPIRFNLLFERFINPERIDLPDADLDFQSTKREKVIDYIVDKYGDKNVAGITNYSTLASASALRDVARVFEVPPKELGCTKLIPKEHGKPYELDEAADAVAPIADFKAKHPVVWDHAVGLEGVIKSLGRHAAGVVIAGEPLISRAVVETNRGSPVVSWDKQQVEDFGLVKIDVLGLSTLDVLDLAQEYIKEIYGKDIDFMSLPLDDPKTMEAFGKGQTVGVFQFESPGMRKLLRDLAFDRILTFEDLAAATSLYRPGPKDSGLLDDYVAIKQGIRKPYYEHPNVEPALKATDGIIIYQESVMQIARDLCGFSFAKADHMRKAMGKKDKEKMEKLRVEFVSGAASHSGMDASQAEALFDKILNFAAYGFNRSHAVEYSVISYWTMWVKTHYPEVFFAATLTILNDDKLDGIVRDARLHKCEVCPPDINMSTQRFEIVKTSDGHKLITPFHRVKGLTEKTAAQIISTRKKIGGRFNEIADLEHIKGQRQFTKKQQEALDAVGAFAQIDPGSKAANDPERRKAQLELMPGLIIDHVFTSRAPVSGADIKDILVRDVIKPVRACKGCSLAGGVHPIPRLGKSPEIMIVTDAPNYSEEKANAMYSGKASGFLKEAIDSSGLDSSRAYFTSLVKSPKSEKVLTPEQINGCVGYLKKELEIIKPSVIVTLGAESTKFFMPGLKGGWAENTNKVFYSSEYDANVVIGFNPSMIAFAVERQAQLNEVFQTVSELLV